MLAQSLSSTGPSSPRLCPIPLIHWSFESTALLAFSVLSAKPYLRHIYIQPPTCLPHYDTCRHSIRRTLLYSYNIFVNNTKLYQSRIKEQAKRFSPAA